MDEIKKQSEMNAQMPRFTENEIKELKVMFKDNDYRLKLLRKFFLPPFDYNAPMGYLFDIYGMIPADNMSDQQAANLVRARNMLITHMNRMFIELESIANAKEETQKEKEERMRKDSVK